MDGEDHTLPVELNGSLDPSRLPNVTLGDESLMTSYFDPYTPFKMASRYSGTGRRSPVKTIRDTEQALSDLQKENFSLKLRIYHMEERFDNGNDEQDVIKTNIELKVKLADLEQELAEKQLYINKAAQAVSTMTYMHQQELERCKTEHKASIDEMKQELEKSAEECEESRKNADDAAIEVKKLECAIQSSKQINEELSEKFNEAQSCLAELESRLKDTDGMANDLRKQMGRKDRDIHRLSICFQDNSLLKPSSVLESQHLQDKYDDQLEEIEKLKNHILDLEAELRNKDDRLVSMQGDADQNQKELDDNVLSLAKCKATIRELLSKLSKAYTNSEAMKEKVKTLEPQIEKLQSSLDALKQENKQILNESQLTSGHNDQLLHRLNEDRNMAEGLLQSLGKKQGEIVGFQEQLTKAMEALSASDTAVEELQMQLRRERAEFESKLRNQVTMFGAANSDANDGMSALKKQVADLQTIIADQNVSVMGLERELSDIGRQNTKLKDREKELMNDRDGCNQKILLLEREIQALRLDLERKDMRIGSLQQNTIHIERPCHEGSNRLDVNVQLLPLNVMEDMRLLVDNLRQELLTVKVLQTSLQTLENSGETSDTLKSEIEAIHKVYQQLEEGVLKNSQLHQCLINSMHGKDSQKTYKDVSTTPILHTPNVGKSSRLSAILLGHHGDDAHLQGGGDGRPSGVDGRLSLSDLNPNKDESIWPPLQSFPIDELSESFIPDCHLTDIHASKSPSPINCNNTELSKLEEFSIQTDSLTDDAKEVNLWRHSDVNADLMHNISPDEARGHDRASLLRLDSGENNNQNDQRGSPKCDAVSHVGDGNTSNQNFGRQSDLINLFSEPQDARSPHHGGANGSFTSQFTYDESNIDHNDSPRGNVKSPTDRGNVSADLLLTHPNITRRSSGFSKTSLDNITSRSDQLAADISSRKVSKDRFSRGSCSSNSNLDNMSPRTQQLLELREEEEEPTKDNGGVGITNGHDTSGEASSRGRVSSIEQGRGMDATAPTLMSFGVLSPSLLMTSPNGKFSNRACLSTVTTASDNISPEKLSHPMLYNDSQNTHINSLSTISIPSSTVADRDNLSKQSSRTSSVSSGHVSRIPVSYSYRKANGQVVVSPAKERYQRNEASSGNGENNQFVEMSDGDILHSPRGIEHNNSYSNVENHANNSNDDYENAELSSSPIRSSLSSTSSSPSTRKLSATMNNSHSSTGDQRSRLNDSSSMANKHDNVTFNGPSADWYDKTTNERDCDVGGSSLVDDMTMTSMLVTDYTYLHKRLSILSESILPSGSKAVEDSFVNTTTNVEKLQARLAHLERIIVMHKEEITAYESLLASMGVPVLLSSDGHSGSVDIDTKEGLLRQHLIEIKKLRNRLENLDLDQGSDQLLIYYNHTQQRITHQEQSIAKLEVKLMEKEESLSRQNMETEHKLNREKAVLAQELKSAKGEIDEGKLLIEELERIKDRMIEDLHTKEEEKNELLNQNGTLKCNILKLKSENASLTGGNTVLKGEIDTVRGENSTLSQENEELMEENTGLNKEKAEIEEDLVRREKEFLDMEKTMFRLEMAKEEVEAQNAAIRTEVEENEKQLLKQKSDLDHSRETCRNMKDILRMKEESLQEKVQSLTKMAQEKMVVDEQLVNLSLELEEIKVEANLMKQEAEEKKLLVEDHTQLKEELAKLKTYTDNARRLHEQIQEEKSELEITVVRLSDENKMLKTGDKKIIEELSAQLEAELKTKHGLGEEVSNLRTMFNKRCNLESQLKTHVAELEAALKHEEMERETLKAELAERKEKVQKRDKQCQFVLDRFGKLEAAYSKQRTILKDKIAANDSLKKQVQLYEKSLTIMSKDGHQDTMKELFQELMLTKKQVSELLCRLEESSKIILPEMNLEFMTNHTTSSSSSTTKVTTETVHTESTSHEQQILSDLANSQSTVTSTTDLLIRSSKDVAGSSAFGDSYKNFEIQSLCAIYKLDNHEKVQKQAGECLISLSGLEARIDDRLKAYRAESVTESMDYSTLREAGMTCHQLRTCLTEVSRLISLAWITELPPVSEEGRFYDPEIETLRSELADSKSKYAQLDQTVKEQQNKLHVSKRRQKDWESSVCRQLLKTSQDLEQAKENLDLSQGILQQVNTNTMAKVAKRRSMDGDDGVFKSPIKPHNRHSSHSDVE